MTDLVKVIKALRSCAGDGGPSRVCPDDCPYRDVDETRGFCDSQLMWDAAAFLEEVLHGEDDGK